jgi:hypothetical protein
MNMMLAKAKAKEICGLKKFIISGKSCETTWERKTAVILMDALSTRINETKGSVGEITSTF